METATTLKLPSSVWRNKYFVGSISIMGFCLPIAYEIIHGFSPLAWLCFALFLVFSGFTMTAGYHRLWAHQSYEAHPILKILFAIWGTTIQFDSILKWASNHRRYHQNAKSTSFALFNPQSQSRSFSSHRDIKDLVKDPVVRFQHRHFRTITLTTNLLSLGLISILLGNVVEAILLIGCFRITLSHFLIRYTHRLSHLLGKQPFIKEPHIYDNDYAAVVLLGEGYLNFHNAFPSDYRCGYKWSQLDFTKWMIYSLSLLGLTNNLKITANEDIEKTRIQVQYMKLHQALSSQPEKFSAELKDLEKAHHKLIHSIEEWSRLKEHWLKLKSSDANTIKSFEHTQVSQQYSFLRNTLQTQRYQWRELTYNAKKHLEII